MPTVTPLQPTRGEHVVSVSSLMITVLSSFKFMLPGLPVASMHPSSFSFKQNFPLSFNSCHILYVVDDYRVSPPLVPFSLMQVQAK